MLFGPYPATVLDVHDGDTFTVDLDLGFGLHAREFHLRVTGINAPELATDAGKAALAHLLSFMPVGSPLTVWSFGWDKYGGRFDGRAIMADGTNVGAKMLTDGFAVPFGGVNP